MSLVSNCSSSILLTSVEGSCEGFSLVPGGSSPDASSNDVACRRFCWIFSKCCLGEISCDVGSLLACIGSGVFSNISCDMSVVYLSILESLDSTPRRENVW